MEYPRVSEPELAAALDDFDARQMPNEQKLWFGGYGVHANDGPPVRDVVLDLADARALLRDAAEALREALPYVGEFEGPMYGPFPGGDPREFTPDREDNTPEEVAAWEAACAEWDTGNGVDRGPGCDYMGDGSARTGTGFGMGSWTVKAPEAERIRELLARIEGGAS